MVKNKGFTLIEIMVVVAIIFILASVVVPVFQDKVQRSPINTDENYKTEISINGVKHRCDSDGDCVAIE